MGTGDLTMDKLTKRILIADDDKDILNVLNILLTGEGYDVITASNGQEALALADSSIDLYILDVDMPVMSGFAASAEIRKRHYAPIIFLTAYSGDSDRSMGFSAGADDYMVKPFSNTELLLRIKALLRRANDYSLSYSREIQSSTEAAEIRYKDLVLDRNSRSLYKNGQLIMLTYTEFSILELFLEHRKKIYSLENIYQSVWGEDAVGDGTIMVHIKNIRKKLGDDPRNPEYIRTAWGKGYYVD